MACNPEFVQYIIDQCSGADIQFWYGSKEVFVAKPQVLASPISFFIMLGYLPVIAKRIRNEEKVLEEGLEDYSEYKKKVKYRSKATSIDG